MPDLANVILALGCEEFRESVCEHCPYGYSYFDESGDHPFWTCDEEKKSRDAVMYLKLYQYLISCEEVSGK